MKQISLQEVQSHKDDLWVIINNKVYDLSKFSKVHPGGRGVLLAVGGKDATEEFFSLHREDVLQRMGEKLCIGHLQGQTPIELSQPGDISQVPYAESSAWSKGFNSIFYTESHKIFRSQVRKAFDLQIKPLCQQWVDNGAEPSREFNLALGQMGFWAMRLGPGPHLEGQKLFNVDPRQFDYFHELIIIEELIATGYPGVADSIGVGLVIGLPPVMHFGSEELKKRIIPECIKGEKVICLAISDPNAGSDVANLTCVAKKSPCGKFYIVNGVKKWISNGKYADYFVTAVRTGDAGIFGVSLMLIEKQPGIQLKSIHTSLNPSGTAGTAYVIFDNVKVPVENLLGNENEGFKVIMYNFNHERWYITVSVNRTNRLILEECYKWAHQRKVFGKSLISQPVIRNKLAQMTAQVEVVTNWIENITYQMNKMNYKQQSKYLAGPIALCKMQCTRASQFIADHACQIFGGRAITRTGMGQVVERFQKTYKYAAIYGGSEEIMADLGIKMAIKDYPENAKL